MPSRTVYISGLSDDPVVEEYHHLVEKYGHYVLLDRRSLEGIDEEFDGRHAGHVKLICEAAKSCDIFILVVPEDIRRMPTFLGELGMAIAGHGDHRHLMVELPEGRQLHDSPLLREPRVVMIGRPSIRHGLDYLAREEGRLYPLGAS